MGDSEDDDAELSEGFPEPEELSEPELEEESIVAAEEVAVDINNKPIPLSSEQMVHKVLAKISELEEKIDRSPVLNPVAKGKGKGKVAYHGQDSFTLTPSKKSLAKWRSKAGQAALKVIFQRVALHAPNVPLMEVVGAIALAINLSAPFSTGSISGAFMRQMKKALNQLLREVKSDLVGWILDTFIMVHHAVMPPRVSKAHADMYEARKAIHLVQFAEMLDAPGGYEIANYPHMHAFHAVTTENGVRTAFEGFESMTMYLPPHPPPRPRSRRPRSRSSRSSRSRAAHTLAPPSPLHSRAALPCGAIAVSARVFRQLPLPRVHQAAPPPHPLRRPPPEPQQPLLHLRRTRGAPLVRRDQREDGVRPAGRQKVHPGQVRVDPVVAHGRGQVPDDVERAHPHPRREPQLQRQHAGALGAEQRVVRMVVAALCVPTGEGRAAGRESEWPARHMVAASCASCRVPRASVVGEVHS